MILWFQEREELEEAGVKVPEGQIGKKKMAKLQQKAEKKKVCLFLAPKRVMHRLRQSWVRLLENSKSRMILPASY